MSVLDMINHQLRGSTERKSQYLPIWAIQLLGGKMVEIISGEPDPVTFRDQFYYNSRNNKLYVKSNNIWIPATQGIQQQMVTSITAEAMTNAS